MDSLLVGTDLLLPLALRAVVVFAFLLVALRIAGRRELAQMTSFDLILLLVVSNAVQNSITAGDTSLTGGLVSAAVLIGVNWAIGYAVWRWRRVERLLQGNPLRLVTDGKIHLGALRQSGSPWPSSTRPSSSRASPASPTAGRSRSSRTGP